MDCAQRSVSPRSEFFGPLEMCDRDSSIWTWHAPGMAVGAWDHFMPAASVGRREEESRAYGCSELCGGGTELHGCEQEQHQQGPAMTRSSSQLRTAAAPAWRH